MNRIIRFRARATKDGSWNYGYLYSKRESSIVKWYMVDINGCCHVAVDINTAGQFTGLFDKDGKAVYEGDIVEVKATNEIGVVVWEESQFQVNWEEGESFYATYLALCSNYSEIIGNIHENPNLLTHD